MLQSLLGKNIRMSRVKKASTARKHKKILSQTKDHYGEARLYKLLNSPTSSHSMPLEIENRKRNFRSRISRYLPSKDLGISYSKFINMLG